MRILGIDPSSVATGYGILESREDGDALILAYGAIKPNRKAALPERLLEIKTGIENLISEYTPDEVAVENPFFGLNIKTAITLGQVRGAVLVAVAGAALPLSEYSPLEIKKAVTGYGQAEKIQVGVMIRALLRIEDDAMEEDAADALACAFCHLNTTLARKNLEENTF
ncbi:MAG: crossover junction endodeoxyribonuclease RuvC [Candidatus Aminicenantes bacterium]|nr:crossover junction endodeoxyribonuclease RuvC [Candidatus Aminicenantes bacterium]